MYAPLPTSVKYIGYNLTHPGSSALMEVLSLLQKLLGGDRHLALWRTEGSH